MSTSIQETPPRTSFAIMSSAVKKDFIPSPEELKNINSFMMCRWISNHPAGVQVANMLNNATDIPIDAQYWFVRSTMHNIRYIAYQKKSSDIDKDLEVLSNHYQCNIALAKQYYKILPKEELNKILTKYNHVGKIKW
jgi:hypothetical protein